MPYIFSIFLSPLAIWKTLENWTGWTAGLFSNETEACEFNITAAANHSLAYEESAQCILQVRQEDIDLCPHLFQLTMFYEKTKFVLLFAILFDK